MRLTAHIPAVQPETRNSKLIPAVQPEIRNPKPETRN